MGTLASPSSRFRVRLPPCQGDASVPTLHPSHSRPYETNPLPNSLHKNLPVKVPSPHIRHPRPYGDESASQAVLTDIIFIPYELSWEVSFLRKVGTYSIEEGYWLRIDWLEQFG